MSLRWLSLRESHKERKRHVNMLLEKKNLPPECEVETIRLAYHFYRRAGTLEGVEVLLKLAQNLVPTYAAAREFGLIAKLLTALCVHRTIHFGIDLLVQQGQLDVLLETESEAVRNFGAAGRTYLRMAIGQALRRCRPDDAALRLRVLRHFNRIRDVREAHPERCYRALCCRPSVR